MKKLVAILMALLSLTSIVGFATSQEETTTTTTTPTVTTADFYLSEYPDYFFDAEGNFNTLVVVGADAKAIDVVGAVDVMARLAGESYDEVEIPASEYEQVAGRQEENIPLGSPIAGFGLLDEVLTDNEVKGLLDTTITFQDDVYDVHEEIRIDATSPTLETSLTANDEDYEEDVYMELERYALSYYYVFDDDLNLTAIPADDLADEPLEIDFLGSRLSITKVKGDDSFTAQFGEKVFMTEGETKTIAGKSVTLDAVADDDKVIVIVDGEKEIVDTGTTLVKGLKIKVLMSFAPVKEAQKGFAQLLVGKEIEEEYEDGDEYIGESKSDPFWIWHIADLDTDDPVIGVRNEQVLNDYEDDPAKEGDCYRFPDNYVSVCFHKLSVKEDDYATYELEHRDSDDLSDAGGGWTGYTSEPVFRFTSSEDDGILLDKDSADWDSTVLTEDVKTDRIYILSENATSAGRISIFYLDKDNDVAFAGKVIVDGSADKTVGYVNYRSTKGMTMPLTFTGNLTNNTLFFEVESSLTTNDDVGAWLYMDGSGDFISLGANGGQSESSELVWDTTAIGSKESDLRTKYGVVIANPDSYGSSDKVNLKIPADQVEGLVYVEGTGVEKEVTEGESLFYRKARILTTPVAKLHTEIPSPETVDANMILIGGSCVNGLVQTLVNNGKISSEYSCAGGNVGAGWKSGEGYLMVVPDAFKTGYTVMVVAGTSGGDTRNACLALQNFQTTMQGITSLNAKLTSPTSISVM